MKPLSRRESIIAVALTSTVAITLVLWVLSYSYTIVIGWERSRDTPATREYSFSGLHVRSEQLVFGRFTTHIDLSNFPATLPTIDPAVENRRLRWLVTEPHESLWLSAAPRNAMQQDTLLGRLGFEHVHTVASATGQVRTDRALFLPWWSIFLLTLAVTLRWTFFRERRLFWRKRNRCPTCGYDLRATAERCPECGAVPVKAPA